MLPSFRMLLFSLVNLTIYQPSLGYSKPKFDTNNSHILICFYQISIIITSHNQHGYPWSSLATPPYRPLLPAGLQGYIPYRHTAAVCRFELVVLPSFVHRTTSLISSSLLLQQCSACLVRLTLIVFVICGRWPYSCCFVGCSLHDSQHSCVAAVKLFPHSFS